MNQELAEQIRKCESLPTIPGVAVEILRIASEKSSDAAKVAQIVSVDPGLTARILRTVNTSQYNDGQPVETLQQAIDRLGIRTVKVLILGFSLSSNLIGGSSGRLDMAAYWRRSVYSAAAARRLAIAASLPRADTCFLSALLMDMGMLAMDQVLGEEYARLVAAAPSHRALAEAEQKALGMTHADASAILAEHWHLPPLVRDSIALHHLPGKAPGGSGGTNGAGAAGEAKQQTAELMRVAARCADVFMEPVPLEALTEVRRECVGRYGIPEAECDEVLCEVGKAGVELSALLEARFPGAPAVSPGPPAAPPAQADPPLARRAADQVRQGGSDAKGASGADKRRAPRAIKQGSMFITPCTEGAGGKPGSPVRVNFRDLSRTGIGLTHNKAMLVGSQFLLNLPRQGGDTVPIVCTVVRCVSKGDNYDIGAQITAVHRPGGAT